MTRSYVVVVVRLQHLLMSLQTTSLSNTPAGKHRMCFGSRAVVLRGLVFFIFSFLMILCSGLHRKAFKASDANEQVFLITAGKPHNGSKKKN